MRKEVDQLRVLEHECERFTKAKKLSYYAALRFMQELLSPGVETPTCYSCCEVFSLSCSAYQILFLKIKN